MLRALLALIFAVSMAARPASAQGAPPAPRADWYYVASNQVLGGYTLGEMQDMATRGVIRPATQVYDPALGWAYAKDTPDLQRYLAEVAPPPAPSAPPPATPSGDTVQAELDARIAAVLEGGWRSVQRETIAGRAFETTTELHFRRDGSYEGFMATALPASPDLQPLTEPMSGRWTARALAPDRFVLSLDGGKGLPPDQMALKIENNAVMVSTDGQTRFERVP